MKALLTSITIIILITGKIDKYYTIAGIRRKIEKALCSKEISLLTRDKCILY